MPPEDGRNEESGESACRPGSGGLAPAGCQLRKDRGTPLIARKNCDAVSGEAAP